MKLQQAFFNLRFRIRTFCVFFLQKKGCFRHIWRNHICLGRELRHAFYKIIVKNSVKLSVIPHHRINYTHCLRMSVHQLRSYFHLLSRTQKSRIYRIELLAQLAPMSIYFRHFARQVVQCKIFENAGMCRKHRRGQN